MMRPPGTNASAFFPRLKAGGLHVARIDTGSIITYIKGRVSPARFKHTLGTWKTALQLAERYGADRDKVTLAALLHDAGKGLSREAMIRYVRKHRIAVPFLDDTIRYNPSLLHGYISAHISRTVFGVTDKDILNAITLHTLGGPRMTILAKIIYLADATSPDRRYAVAKQIRRMSRRDLDRAFIMAMCHKMFHVVTGKKWLHPAAVKTWNAYTTQKTL